MGLLSRKKESKSFWLNLNDANLLSEIDEASKEKPVVIFKHSTRCSISSMALSRLERSWNQEEMDEVDAYYLDLIAHRDISNAIADKYNVYHQSPQVIVIKDGKSIYDDSHMDISYDTLKQRIESI